MAIWGRLLESLDWQRPEAILLWVFLAWLATGLLLMVLPVRNRLTWYAFAAVALQALLYGSAWPAFQVLNLAVYCSVTVAVGLAARPAKARHEVLVASGPAETLPEPESDNQVGARRWQLCCVGMFALIALAFALRDLGLSARLTVAVGGFDVPLLVLTFWHLVRLITLLHEVGSGTVPLPSLRDYVLWVNLPLVGLIIRPAELADQLSTLTRRPAWGDCFSRDQVLLLATGVAKVVGSVVFTAVRPEDIYPASPWVYKAAGVFVFGPWGFVLMQAGLWDVQRFIGRFWNLDVPIGWNAPLWRTNLSAFWANWNITLTRVYRDYLFFNRWGLERPNLYLNTVIVFVAMGLWHAGNLYWLFFGLLHAAGFCFYLWFQQLKRDYPWLAAEPTRLTRFGGWLLTYVFVCMCWYVPSKLVTFIIALSGSSHVG